jgi:hypothetical protein
LGKWEKTIDYDDSEKCFYTCDGGSADKINDINTFTIPSNWIRLSGPQIQNNFFINLINEKQNIITPKKANDKEVIEIHKLLKHFFVNLQDNNFDKVLEDFSFKNDIKIINFDGSVSTNNRDQIKAKLHFLRDCFLNNNDSVEVYSDVYFSENVKLVNNVFGECHLIELKYPNTFSYFYFIVKSINARFMIIGYRNELDME